MKWLLNGFNTSTLVVWWVLSVNGLREYNSKTIVAHKEIVQTWFFTNVWYD